MPSLVPIPRQASPSYKSGYARSASESANSGLWDGLVYAACPSMGTTGGVLHDLSGHGRTTDILGTVDWEDRAWNTNALGYALPPNDGVVGKALSVLVRAYTPDESNNNFRHIIGRHDDWKIQAVGDDIRFNVNGTTSTTDYTMTDGETATFMGVYDGVNGSFYANGDLVVAFSETGAIANTGVFCLGDVGSSPATSTRWNGRIYEAMVWDRVLTDQEVRSLSADPLAPFRQRPRYIGFAEAETPASTTSLISYTRRANPSYKSGYARSASESAFPGLWNGLVIAVAPALGNTGDTIRDQSHKNNNGVLDGAAAWGGNYISCDATGDRIRTPANGFSQSVGSIALSYRRTGTVIQYDAFLNVENSANNAPGEMMWWHLTSGGTNFRPNHDANAGRSWSWTTGMNATPLNAWVSYGVSWDNTAAELLGYYQGAIDGSEDGSGSWTTSALTNNEEMAIGGLYAALGAGCHGDINAFLAYDRVLSPQEFRILSADPLAPFRQRTRYIGVAGDAPAGGLSIPVAFHHYTKNIGTV